MLFTGIEGVGKDNAAVAFAMACNCSANRCRQELEKGETPTKNYLPATSQPLPVNACGRCKSCKKIESGNHPDIIRVKPLLPTIVSRCQHIRFNPISRKSLESILVAEHGLDHSEATIIAAMAGGSFSRA